RAGQSPGFRGVARQRGAKHNKPRAVAAAVSDHPRGGRARGRVPAARRRALPHDLPDRGGPGDHRPGDPRCAAPRPRHSRAIRTASRSRRRRTGSIWATTPPALLRVLDHGSRPRAYNIAMISVQDGQNRILAQITRTTSPELVPLGKALGRVVAEDVRAPFDVPPADNSAVDGYAVGSADIPAGATRDLRVVADLPAGSVFDGALAS